jgi:hypothetical protein
MYTQVSISLEQIVLIISRHLLTGLQILLVSIEASRHSTLLTLCVNQSVGSHYQVSELL